MINFDFIGDIFGKDEKDYIKKSLKKALNKLKIKDISLTCYEQNNFIKIVSICGFMVEYPLGEYRLLGYLTKLVTKNFFNYKVLTPRISISNLILKRDLRFSLKGDNEWSSYYNKGAVMVKVTLSVPHDTVLIDGFEDLR